jgi:hypothetical protein
MQLRPVAFKNETQQFVVKNGSWSDLPFHYSSNHTKSLICAGDERLPAKQVSVFLTIPNLAACSILGRLYICCRIDMAGSGKEFWTIPFSGAAMAASPNVILLSINLLGIAAIPVEGKIHPVCFPHYRMGFGRLAP